MERGKGFCFTINNYTATRKQELYDLLRDKHASNEIHYAIVGDEVAPTTGTRHLQGYVHFTQRARIRTVRNLIVGGHVECARGSPQQNHEYCKKDGSFVEWGSLGDIPFQGKRSDFDKFKEWLLEQTTWPSDAHIAANWTALYCRYGTRLLELRGLLYPKPNLESEDYRAGWQQDLKEELSEDADDRKIKFICDDEGNNGKSWFIRKYITDNEDGQFLSIAKRDDIAHMVDETKRVFLFNIPRGQMQYMQYGILESIKDRMVFSPKYHGRTKLFVHKPHVVVFCNELPDPEALSADRVEVLEL